MIYRFNKPVTKGRSLSRTLWGSVVALDGLVLIFIITMLLNQSNVLYWLMDDKLALLQTATGGAILGISFSASNLKRLNNLKTTADRAVASASPRNLAWPLSLVNRKEIKN